MTSTANSTWRVLACIATVGLLGSSVARADDRPKSAEELIEKMANAFSNLDFNTAIDCYDEFDLTISPFYEPGQLPWDNTYHGRAGLIQRIADINNVVDIELPIARNVRITGSDKRGGRDVQFVTLTATHKLIKKGTDRSMTTNFLDFYTVASTPLGLKIVQQQFWDDTAKLKELLAP